MKNLTAELRLVSLVSLILLAWTVGGLRADHASRRLLHHHRANDQKYAWYRRKGMCDHFKEPPAKENEAIKK